MTDHDLNNQPARTDSPGDNAAELEHWVELIEKVKGLSPELKEAWYRLKLVSKAD
jgi:hypothetical protein